MSTRPMTVPRMLPLPPKMLVPPSTTAAMASSSSPVPMSLRVVVTLETKMMAASAAIRPEKA